MSLTSKAVDRLIARVVNRLADRVPAATPFPVSTLDDALRIAKDYCRTRRGQGVLL